MKRTNEGAIASMGRNNSGLLMDGFPQTILTSFAAQTEALTLLENFQITLKYFLRTELRNDKLLTREEVS